MNISGVGEMRVGETGVGEMGQTIGEMGVGETGTSLYPIASGGLSGPRAPPYFKR